ncbi:MAG: hypothetical protein MR272_06115 [Pseudoflavonifractor sp.]|nr:hypothetical protein [Pseudoflavonifractor sp.]MDY3019337.1 hypothetical protein [Oscillospiraceae bacterium]
MRPFDAPEEDNVGGDFDRVLRAALLDAQRSKWAPCWTTLSRSRIFPGATSGLSGNC